MRSSRRDRPLAGVPGSDISEAEGSPERLRGVPGGTPTKRPASERTLEIIGLLSGSAPQLRERLVAEFKRAQTAILADPSAARRPKHELPPPALSSRPPRHLPALEPAATARSDGRPARRMAIVTCMDPRVDALRALGLGDGDAHVLRNAGGIVTDDVIRSLAVSQHVLQTREVILVQHTDCGMARLDANRLRAELVADAGVAPPFAVVELEDLDEELRRSIRRVRRCPLLPHRDRVRGYIYDVHTHRLREIRDT